MSTYYYINAIDKYYSVLNHGFVDNTEISPDGVTRRYLQQLLEITLPSGINLRKWRLLDPHDYSRQWLVPPDVLHHATVRLLTDNEWEKRSAKCWAKPPSTKSRRTPKIGIKVPGRSPESFIPGELYEQAIRDQQLNTAPGIGQSLISEP